MTGSDDWVVDLAGANPEVRSVVGTMLAQPPELGLTLGVLVVKGGRVIAEGYGPKCGSDAGLVSWSMAKSVTHALIGLLVVDGRLEVDAPAPVPAWQHDDRSGITVQHLLNMRSGLRFNEDYVDAQTSHCIEMLFGDGKADVAGYAAALPLDHAPGTVWNYASGTTNILCRIAGDLVGGGEEGMRAYLHDRLFAPLGMTSADPRFDDAGTFIGSSFLYATARDFARFGELYLHDGVAAGRRILPDGWVGHARTPIEVPDTETFGYGAHWWLWREHNAFASHGYEGQYIIVVPAHDAIVVRLGKTVEADKPALWAQLHRLLDALATD